MNPYRPALPCYAKLWTCLLTATLWPSLSQASSDKQLAPEAGATIPDTNEGEFLLRYKFKAGENLRWDVLHLVTVETRIQGTTQTAETRSSSTKAWHVTSVDSNGHATFSHLVEKIDMWQQVTGRDAIEYNSQRDKSPPPEYENAAANVGIPLSTITLNAQGEIVERHDRRKTPGFGGGQVTIPLPKNPVQIGATWDTPNMIPVRRNDGKIANIKSRQVFQLKKVVAGLATISVRTEILTPINDPKIQAQLVQRLTNGSVKFDIGTGRVVRQRIELKEKVLAFNGADSAMNYKARFTEELLATSKETPTDQAVTTKNNPGDSADKPQQQARKTNRRKKASIRR
ncbi:MAG: hypothetical protein CMJ81_15465 [Planctomycetaceae bacterium]|nr:hypothetical protein [Planctomycetaceae bacterium]